MDRILVQIQELTLDDMFTAIADSTRILSRTEMTILIVLAAAGALFCLFGLKIVRFWAAVLGLEEALRLNPNDAETTVQLGDVYLSLKDKDKALKAYEKAISLGIPRSALLEQIKKCK